MKKIINLLLILLFASITSAIIVENPLPTITTTFSESVIVESINATLKDDQNNIRLIENTFTSPDNKTFKYRPIDYLQEGSYSFIIHAQDIYGNYGDIQTQSFTIAVPPPIISLIIPKFGVSSTSIFNLSIKTSLPSECRWAIFEDKLYENMGSFFETTEGINHTVIDFDITALTATNLIYTACKTSYDNSTEYQSFELSVDPTPPVITTISANEVTEEPLESIIQLTTDDNTVCRYSKENVPYSEMNFFINLDEHSFSSYKSNHASPLNSQELEDYSINTIYIICKNLAELLSETYTLNINVDTAADATITINSPQHGSYYSSSSLVLNITTNKLAVCYFSNTSENIFGGGGTFGGSSGVYYHLSNPIYFIQGSYTYYFKCFIDPPEGLLPIESTNFTIDTTPPIMLYVNDSNPVPGMQNLTEFTYYTNKLEVKWDAVDDESGIMKYEYSLWKNKGYSPAELIKDWTEIEQGNEGDVEECNNICNDDKGDCNVECGNEKNDCENVCSSTKETCKDNCEGEEDETECRNTCDVEENDCDSGCGDIKTNCDGSCNNEKEDCSLECSSKSKEIKPLELEDKEKYYFTFKAQNNAGGWSQELSSNGITVDLALLSIGTCNNGVQDFNETDVDCGSLCDKCSLNQSCNIYEDCLSNYCNIFNKCDTLIGPPQCTDGIKNQNETDIDCGGNCLPCQNGQACSINEDCQNNNCDPNLRLCIVYDDCANNILDINETDIDCGGKCLPCNNGGACILDSDCISNYCSTKTNKCKEFTLCGNGIIEPGEQCENSTDAKTCSLFGFEAGTLSCGEDCLFNTSLCIGENGTCGDTEINPREQCEGLNWGKVKGCFDFNEFESGKLNCQECILNTNKCSKEVDPKQDTDRDGMPDVCELKYFKHRTRAKPNEDPDEDGLTNEEECKLCRGLGTNPKEKDTDGDGYKDKKEVEKDTDPCDSEEYPKSSFFFIILSIILILSLFGGGGYYLYSRKIVSFSQKPPYILFSKPVPPPPKLKAPGMIEFIKTPPYVKLNADISFITKPPFIVIKSTLPPPPPQIQQQLTRPITQSRPLMRTQFRRTHPARRPITPRKKAQPVGLVLKKRQRRKVLETFKTEKKEEDKDKKEE